MKITHQIKAFNELSTSELYEILKLRSEVFVLEQQCLYQDIDDKDQASHHLLCYIRGKLAGYTRLLPPGTSYTEASIGRVLIAPEFRGMRLGWQLMEKSILSIQSLFGTSEIRIGAQVYLKRFYNSLGFIETGAPYNEDGILHIEMCRM